MSSEPKKTLCCEAIAAAIATFSTGTAAASENLTKAILANFPNDPLAAAQRLAAAFAAALQVGVQVRAALSQLADINCPGPCCAAAAASIGEIGVAFNNNISTAAASPFIPFDGPGQFTLQTVIRGLLAALAQNLQIALSVANQSKCTPCHRKKC